MLLGPPVTSLSWMPEKAAAGVSNLMSAHPTLSMECWLPPHSPETSQMPK